MYLEISAIRVTINIIGQGIKLSSCLLEFFHGRVTPINLMILLF